MATTLHEIAQQYSNLGQYEKALQALENVLSKPIKNLNLIWEQQEAEKRDYAEHNKKNRKNRNRRGRMRMRSRRKNDDAGNI